MKTIQALLTIGGAILMLSACGASSVVSTPTEPASTPTVQATPPPTPTPDLVAIAGQAYLRAVTAVNAVGANVSKEEAPLKTYSALVKPERQWLAGLDTFQTALYKITWPPSVESQATALVAANQTTIGAVQDFVANPNAANWASDTSAGNAFSSASAAIRLALHLPPVSQS